VKRAALLYAVLTIVLAWPLSIHPATTVLSDAPDENLYLWTLAWDAHAFVRQPLRIFDANIYYPARRTLAYSENLIGSAVLAAPIIWITGNLVLATNAVALLAAVLCGLGTFLLARRIGTSTEGALAAGVIFAFAPPRFLRLDQLHLATIQWVPFALAYLHAYLDDGRARDLRWFVLFLTLQVLTSGHGAVFLLVAAALVAGAYAVADRRLRLGRSIRDLGLPGAACLAVIALVMIPYRAAQVGAGLRRSLENWTVPAESFFASPSHIHTWLLTVFGASWVNDRAQAYLFPGVLATSLALVGLAAHGLRRRARIAYALVVLIAVLLSIGPPLSLWPLVYWLPGFDFIRAPSRFMMLALLGLAVLAGAGFDVFAKRAATTRMRWAIVTCALLAAEYATIPFALTLKKVEIPTIDRRLAAMPDVRAIAEVPLVDPRHLQASEMRHTTYMLHTTAHWRKTVEGYSGIRPELHQRLYDALLGFPDARSLTALADVGVTHIVVHVDLYDPAEWPEVDAGLHRFGNWLRLEGSTADGRIYALQPPR
jgi:hypothetical protein